MKKNLKSVFGLCLAIGLSIVFIACVSVPRGPIQVQVYTMEKMPTANTLMKKTAVVFDLAMAERVLPKKNRGSSGGPLANAAIHRSYIKLARSEQIINLGNKVLASQQASFIQNYFGKYEELFNAKPVQATFNFDGEIPAFEYFRANTDSVKQKIIEACKTNRTNFAIVMVGQLVNAETMGVPTLDTANSTVKVEVYLFNNLGELLAIGLTETMVVGIHHREEKFIAQYSSLLADAFENIILMLPALGGNGEPTATKEFMLTY